MPQDGPVGRHNERNNNMIIIAEKINGAVPKTGKAIREHDTEYIKEIAMAQAEVMDEDQDYIDCCSGVELDEEEVLKWLIETVQENTDFPIAIDSPDPAMCVKCMQYCDQPGLINSVSLQAGKIETVFPVLAQPENKEWGVIALLSDEKGAPADPEARFELAKRIFAAADEYGISYDRLFIDPVVEAVGPNPEALETYVETAKMVKEYAPDCHILSVTSNISFGLPVRKVINMAFQALALNAGADSAIIDPLSRDLRGVAYATEALLGEDEYCGEYLGAYRDGIFGPIKD